MLQRLVLTVLLITSFGFAQMGAVTHEISHYAELNLHNPATDSAQNLSAESQKNDGQKNHSCEKCIGYAGIGHAVASSTLVLAVTATSKQPHAADAAIVALSTRFNYCARAPPTIV